METPDPLRVHIGADTGLQSEEVFQKLLAGSPGSLDVTYGAKADSPFSLLVSSRPGPELLACPELRVLLVPVAGVPAPVWRDLEGFPQVAVHTSHFNAQPTAEMAFALMLSAAKSVVAADRSMREQDWTPRFAPAPSLFLCGSKALVIGYGAVGRRIARFCVGMGMRVDAIRQSAAESLVDDGVGVHPAGQLRDRLTESDVVFVAAALNAGSKGLLGARELELLGPHAVLINVARPEIVDEAALYEALRSHRIGAAGLDIWWKEPASQAEAVGFVSASLPFHTLPNVVLSPHRAGGAGLAGVKRLRAESIAEFIGAAAAGRPLPHREHRV